MNFPDKRPRIFNRAFKPFSLMLVLTMVVLAQSNFRGMDRGTTYPLSLVVGFAALFAAVILVTGWIGNIPRAIEYGLLGVVLAYLIRAWFIMLMNPWDQSIFYSLAVVIGASGAYFLEVAERHSGGWRRGE